MKKVPLWVSMAAGMAIGAAVGAVARSRAPVSMPKKLICKAKSALTALENKFF